MEVDLTPILDAIREMGEKLTKPRKWVHTVKYNQSGGAREIISTAE